MHYFGGTSMQKPFATTTGVFDTIYVFYPRGLRTGGPEALHQLVDALRKSGQQAFLVPFMGTEDAARVRDYEIYDAPEAPRAIDQAGNAVIVPEVWIDLLREFTQAQRMCWWLSIDYSPVFRILRSRSDDKAGLGNEHKVKPRQYLKDYAISVRPRRELVQSTLHLAQSHYAWAYLYAQLNVVPTLLGDYTPLFRIEGFRSDVANDRGRTVAYNPKKGSELTERVIAKTSDIEWRPLIGMSADDVCRSLASTAIYLDLGQHPGKDRMPREAAYLGAVTIVARRGAGAFTQDVPLPWQHKVQPTDPHFLERTVALLDQVLAEPQAHRDSQNEYRSALLREKEVFFAEVQRAFVEGHFYSDSSADLLPHGEATQLETNS
ncbi:MULTISPECIES: hypothetical protein [unclassified Cryobacterium]|uniref:hypothetical protein n=1 Tax=unclassified Cryobacterium TaxID=2649013 RepID=UPI00106CBBA4|nr:MULTISPECIES: hypothetical protein [unclassified Cryobacterium]TFC56974.1 hypothetical protein E3O68_03090 [Cryobacterium sp. TMB3-1-2]TFC67931.1 hypothetical protein E3T21_15890 [Cryobacterium sp. TMB3-15]TFC76850.1 hypothetical protein E3T22_07800 [Cryobacterium sp. TMB3-10]TFD42267.1 hypothetical protein E3T58_09385 [Cryobacterium sp. TMB3-12]